MNPWFGEHENNVVNTRVLSDLCCPKVSYLARAKMTDPIPRSLQLLGRALSRVKRVKNR